MTEKTVEEYIHNRIKDYKYNDNLKTWQFSYRPSGKGAWKEITSDNGNELFLDMNIKQMWYEKKFKLIKLKDNLLQKIR